MNENKRIIFLDVLKIMAIVMVIFDHSHWYIYNNTRFILGIHLAIYNIIKAAVPIFLMVSGYLMLSRKTTYKEILTKRIPIIFIGTLISSIVGAIVLKLNIFDVIIKTLYGGQIKELYFLWYMYLLLILYLLTPLLSKMIEKFTKKDYYIFFILFIIIPSVIATISSFCSYVIKKPINIANIFIESKFLINIGLFVFGYYIGNKEITKKENTIAIFTNILSLVLGLVYSIIRVEIDNVMIELFYYCIPAIGIAMSTFVNCKYYIKNKDDKVISHLSKCTLFIYLSHVYIVETLAKTEFFQKLLNINNILGFVMIVIVTYIIPVIIYSLVVLFIKEIKEIKK